LSGSLTGNKSVHVLAAAERIIPDIRAAVRKHNPALQLHVSCPAFPSGRLFFCPLVNVMPIDFYCEPMWVKGEIETIPTDYLLRDE